jgi:hypothetical protein
MTRKDSEKEADRPHYYSQFWLDVAAGRTTISSSKEVDEIDLAEVEEESEPELEPTPLRRAGRNHGASSSDGYKSTRTQTIVEPDYEIGEAEGTEEKEFGLADDVEELELPDNVLDEPEVEMYSPEEDFAPEEDAVEEEEEDFFFDNEEEEEEEDEEEWGSRGRKKPKPGRQTKAPKPTKKPRRDTRRSY